MSEERFSLSLPFVIVLILIAAAGGVYAGRGSLEDNVQTLERTVTEYEKLDGTYKRTVAAQDKVIDLQKRQIRLLKEAR